MMRKALAVLALVVGIALIVLISLPWIASTQIVRDRIQYELSIWSGYRVALGGVPALKVWPTVTATLKDVSLHEWSDRSGPPVLQAEQVDIELSALAALRGDIVFSAMKLTRPLLRLTRPGAVIDLPASPGGGRMFDAVETARTIVAASPAAPDLSALPRDPFGTIEFTDGRIALLEDGAEQNLVTSLAGKVSWAALNRPASLTATAIWRGENVTLEGSSAQPLVLLASGNAPFRFSMRSPLLNGSFDGLANLSQESFFDGKVSLSSPSLRRTLEWSRTEIAPGAAIGEISITAKMTGTAQRLKLENVALSIGSNSGKGSLNASLAETPPSITGTLDFTRLDIGSFLAAFSLFATGPTNVNDMIDTTFADQIALDLRLSAGNAVLGSVAMTEVAATAQVRGGLAAFDISDATAFGGNVQAGLRIDRSDSGNAIETRLVAGQVDFGELARRSGMPAPLPTGRADVSVTLRGNGSDWNTVLGTAEGSVSVIMGPGSLAGFNLQEFKSRWSKREFFALSEVSGGQLPVRGIDFKATVKSGIARIERATIRFDREMISLEGIVPYLGRALALSGQMGLVDSDGSLEQSDASFFIGGAWNAPYVSPILRWIDEE